MHFDEIYEANTLKSYPLVNDQIHQTYQIYSATCFDTSLYIGAEGSEYDEII